MKKGFVLALLSCLLVGCTGNQEIQRSNVENEIENEIADQVGDQVENEAEVVEADTDSFAAENEKYGLALPKADAFREILQDFIYWNHATVIEKDKDKEYSIFGILEEENCLERELKIHLYYRECDVKEMDQVESNLYDIVVTFPEEEQLSYFSFEYNARGLSSEYDYGYDGWLDDHLDDDISSQELEKNKWFGKHYTSFGETILTIKKAEAEEYEVADKFPAGEKEQILSAIKKSIKKTYKKEDDVVIYIQDFLPGDWRLSGRIVYLDMEDKYDIPLYWIQSLIYYSGAKMEQFVDVFWDTRYSTAYAGGGYEHKNTVKQLRRWAKEEKEAVDVDQCVLAYRIKKGKMIDLKR